MAYGRPKRLGIRRIGSQRRRYVNRVRDLTAAIVGLKDCQGYCYTSLPTRNAGAERAFQDRPFASKISIDKMRKINGITAARR
ncbi:MAG: hypothetical protein ACLUSP_11370 [Christensenellales bacterium]